MKIVEVIKNDSIGIPRDKMPQIHLDDIKDKYKFKQGEVSLDKLKPVQRERIESEYNKAVEKIQAGQVKPIMLDKKFRIVNGHHRHDAYKNLGYERVPAVLVDATLEELMKEFAHTAKVSETIEAEQDLAALLLSYGTPKKKKKKKTNESNEPQFDVEWDEAQRYPEFKQIGKEAWINLAKKGKAVTIKSAKDINNTDASKPESFYDLDKEKQKRALQQVARGQVEPPIVAVYSDGYKELIAGNTRLTAMMLRKGSATVWQFEVPDEVAELAEGDVVGFPGTYIKKEYVSVNGIKMLKDVWEYMSQERKIETGKRNFTGKEDPKLLRKAYQDELINFIDEFEMNDMDPQAFVDELNQIGENFADGKVKGKSRPGRVKRAGASCKGSVSSLRAKAKKYSGERGKMYHWCANMKAGKKK